MLRLIGILALGSMICGKNRLRRENGLGDLLLLPAMLFVGWIAIVVAGRVLSLVGSLIGGIFSGLSSLASGAFSAGGLTIGIVIGLALYFYIRRQKREEE